MPRDGEAGVRANSAQESYSQLKAELQIPRFARNGSGGLQTVRCKNLGDALRVPSFASCSCFSVSFSSWLSSWLPSIYSPFPFLMDSNVLLSQLIQCIESLNCDV